MNLMLIDQLKQLRLSGIKDELERQQQHVNHYQDLDFEARVPLLLNHELTQRELPGWNVSLNRLNSAYRHR